MKHIKFPKRKSPRLKSWDYSQPHWYFVTICTADHINYFSEVKNGKMLHNNLGLYAEECLKSISDHYKNVEVDYYIIMPNHIHAIIIINDVGLRHASTLRKISLGNVIGSLKSAISKWAHTNGFTNFKWQRSFYDRMIRNEKELIRIRKYIEQNPLAWELDKTLLENLEL